ncbi:MAG: SPASM domain-containing protein [Phycisphaerae bacterium]|nr:SPASM domain-containing protein [Phycisphaerae bacterium]
MKVIAAICVDFERSPLGGASRLGEGLAGRRVIDHALSRFARVAGADERWMVVPPEQAEAATRVIAECGVSIRVAPIAQATPRRRLIEIIRKCSLESWRGGPMNGTWFDEFVEPFALARLLESAGADAAFLCEGHQAALDPALASAQIAAIRERAEAAMIFSPAPPGLGGIVLQPSAVETLTSHNLTVGILLTYRPEFPNTDPLIHSTCLHVDPDIAATTGRFCADTRRGMERLSLLFEQCGVEADSAALTAAHRRLFDRAVETLPREVELELTTDTLAPRSKLRPPLAGESKRRLDDRGALAARLAELAAYDDARLTLVGCGDPLRHPRFAEIAAQIGGAGIFATTLVSPLHELSDEQLAALGSGSFDFVEVPIDATSRATYAAIHGVDLFDPVLANIERIEQQRRDTRNPRPVLVPTFTRCAANAHEMDAFYDHWIQRVGSAVIRGYNEFAGALPADTLLHAASPVRRSCGRLWSRMTLLADGRAVRCEQDFQGASAIGDWRSSSLTDLWRGAAMSELRGVHRSLDVLSNGAPLTQSTRPLATLSMCNACREWFRP